MIDPEGLVVELAPLIGRDRSLHTVNYALKSAAHHLRAGAIGAMHVTCSDEAEHESIDAFQTSFAQDLLPRLKFGHRAPFRTSNLGGRYEWHSLPLAESHFATPESERTFKLLVVKINSHVSANATRGDTAYGQLRRYDIDTPCCGLLAAVLEGSRLPSAVELEELLGSEGIDRLAMLRDEVEPQYRSLIAAIVSSRLQARSAVLEAQDHRPATPTLYLVVPTVTLNKPDRDGELVCGIYVVDRRRGCTGDLYRGLGDVPTRYRITHSHGHLEVADDGVAHTRPARDHRQLIDQARQTEGADSLGRSERIDEILAHAKAHERPDHHLTSTLLKGLLIGLAEVTPIPAALLLFAQGASGIFHVFRAHRIVRDVEASGDARRMLLDLHDRVDRLPPEQAEKVLRVLLAEYEERAGQHGQAALRAEERRRAGA